MNAGSRAVIGRLAAFAAILGLAGLPSSAHAAAPRMLAVGTAPPPVAGSRYAGALPGAAPLELTVVLRPRDEAALESFVRAVSTPGSASYGHYLAPGEFGPRFGATTQTIAAVTGALRAAGLDAGRPNPSGLTIPVLAPASAVAAAMHVAFVRFSLPGGRTGFANTTAPQLPADVAGAVADVVGLQTLSRPQALGRGSAISAASSVRGAGLAPGLTAAPSSAGVGPAACAAATAEAGRQRAYTIDQLSAGYGLDPFYSSGDLGTGTTIGIYELEPNLSSDVATFETCFGATTAIDQIPVDGGAGSGAGSGEAAIDIESVIGIAPQSRIEVFQGPDTGSGPLDVYAAIADQDTSQVNTTSWGLCEQDMLLGDPNAIADETPIFQQMIAQGQTLYAASGDHGSEGCMGDVGTPSENSLAVNDPASQTQVTGVGGTSLVATYSSGGAPTAVDSTPLATPPFQTAWNESAVRAGAGGGGISIVHAMPSYQSGAPAGLNVRNSNSSGALCGAPAGSACREVPDVSAAADPVSGSEIYCTNDGTPGTLCASRWEAVGGTSAAAPFWAGMTALVNSDPSAGCTVPTTFGEMNPLLYAIAAGPGHAGALTDIAPPVPSGAPTGNDYGNLHAGLYPVGVGYDMATGLGTPLAAGSGGLADQLCAMRAPVTQAPRLSSLTPSSGSGAAGTTVTIDGSFFLPGATVAVGGTPASGVQVLSFNQLTAVLPGGSGPEAVTVTTSRGASNPLSYTFAASVPPSPIGPTSTTPATPAPPPGTDSPAAPGPSGGRTAARTGLGAAALLLACTGAKLAITDLVEAGGRVLLSGAAASSLAGGKVKILFGARHGEVAVATVSGSGVFRASVALPPASERGRSSAGYEAVLGSLRSASLRLTRRMSLDPPQEIHGRVRLTGRVSGPLGRPPAAIVVREATSCAAGQQVASIRPASSGRFTIELSIPAGARAALYRLRTRVPRTATSRSTIATSSLLESVGLS